jgi:hypothetical protein
MKVSKSLDSGGWQNKSFLAQRILSLVILLQGIGLFIVFFQMHHTHFGSFMFMAMKIEDAKAVTIESITISIYMGLCVLNVLYSRIWILIPIFIYVFFEAWAGYYQGGYHFSELTLGSHALRYLTPLTLALFVVPTVKIFKNINRMTAAAWVLRIGIATVFITHGIECLKQNPIFIDLIIGGTNNILGFRPTEATALQLMQFIGWIDIMVAFLLLLKPLKGILAWTFFWGFITALSRMTSLGEGAYTEVLLRASHILAPVVLYILIYKPVWAKKLSHRFRLNRRTLNSSL